MTMGTHANVNDNTTTTLTNMGVTSTMSSGRVNETIMKLVGKGKDVAFKGIAMMAANPSLLVMTVMAGRCAM